MHAVRPKCIMQPRVALFAVCGGESTVCRSVCRCGSCVPHPARGVNSLYELPSSTTYTSVLSQQYPYLEGRDTPQLHAKENALHDADFFMAESGIVQSWQKDEQPQEKPRGRGFWPQNKGFGFIERENGDSIFCHKLEILDGNALLPGTEVRFDVVPNERKPGHVKAANVTGGTCFHMGFTGSCNRSDCKFSHAERPKVGPRTVSVDEAVAAVASSRIGSPPVLVDTVEACQSQCARLADSRCVAVDFEGVNLCREGELLLAQLAAVEGPVVLVDVATLGARAFDEGGLRALLESHDVLKIVFDGRSDADALFHEYSCRLHNVCDGQVLCALHLDTVGGGRSPNGGSPPTTNRRAASDAPPPAARLPGLGKALTCCEAIDPSHGRALAQLKKAVQPLFVPSLGGSYEAWRARPLTPALIEYAAADVAHLHSLRTAWGHLVSEERMREITAARIESAVSSDGPAKGAHMALRDFGDA